MNALKGIDVATSRNPSRSNFDAFARLRFRAHATASDEAEAMRLACESIREQAYGEIKDAIRAELEGFESLNASNPAVSAHLQESIVASLKRLLAKLKLPELPDSNM